MKKIRIAGAILATALALAALSVRAENAQTNAPVKACASPIATCGCTITKSGFYTLANDLSSSQGVTAKDGCIDIKASKVVLNAAKPVTGGVTHGGFDISGPGGTPPTDIGIHVLKGSNNDFLELPSGIGGWDVGILVEGNNNIVEDFGAQTNGTAGVEVNGGSNNNINDFNSSNNQNYGVWLRGASGNQVNCSNTENNGNIGVYIGCSDNGPINGKCSPAVPASNHNRIYDHDSSKNTKYGVVIDLGNTGNVVTDLGSSANGTMDLLDENANCGSDRWFFDSFDTASPACID